MTYRPVERICPGCGQKHFGYSELCSYCQRREREY